MQATLPVKSKKTAVKMRYFNYLVLHQGGNFYLRERGKGDIWTGLFDFPLIESTTQLHEPDEIYHLASGNNWLDNHTEFQGKSKIFRHKLTHREIHAVFWKFDFKGEPQPDWIEVSSGENVKYPLPRLIDIYLQEAI